MNNKLAINGGKPIISDTSKKQYIWPLISKKTEKAVIKQLYTSISIYNKSGIIKEFEDKFADYHKMNYGLLNSSGTMSLYNVYKSLELKINDEVIVPDYTFFATATPLFHLGAIPILCDCEENGNIDPLKIEKLITSKTKCIVITHMWGIPCKMDAIIKIAEKYKLYLVEDCSHAHGAEYKGQKVGTFGTMSIWSLQGQKILTGGEGGIILTNNKNLYDRSQLVGHYNKRCKEEVDKNNSLYSISTTGFGLKLRAHPLAVAIANEQMDNLDSYLYFKRLYANKIINSLLKYDFLKMPNIIDVNPSWYAFVFQYTGKNIDLFFKALQAEGLTEVDRPNSTAPLHTLELFKEYRKIFSDVYNSCNNDNVIEKYIDSFPNAEVFYNRAIKIPVWATKKDEAIVNLYIKAITKVCDNIQEIY